MDRISEVFYRLVSTQSDTGTRLEVDVENYIYNWLKDLNYFKTNKEYFGKYKLQDHLERTVVWALVKGSGKKTIVLIHHHDVVDSFDYGRLQPLAYKPEELQKAMKDINLSEEAENDLDSGEWIFGRGTADMKAGAAIQLSLIEEYSKLENFNGNLLLISLPDEESLSVGMRGAATLLKELKNKYSLNYVLCIDSEPHEKVDGNKGLISLGSVGKIMPVIYVQGVKSHLKDIFQRFNPLLLLSEIVKNIELNVELSDISHGEVSPPPAWNYFKDRKEVYDASIPPSAGGYFSVLTLKRTPKDILTDVKKLSEKAFSEIIDYMNEMYKSYCTKADKSFEKLPWKVDVKTFSELYQAAVHKGGESFLAKYNEDIKHIEAKIENGEINLPESNFILIERLLSYCEASLPVVVVAFSPPYYPPICNLDFDKLPDNIENLLNIINSFTLSTYDERYVSENYFMGISDMSYAALTKGGETIPYIGPNMPLWEKLYYIPFEDMTEISMPVVNLGPWGKDLHKVTERVYKEDLFVRTPSIIKEVISKIL